ncbi:hypothetical protein COTS27_01450 [Spirochaetota bacterium]|nr:hypothetical protein COTS27_01450 [Spirochaetota bacterium]
MHAIKKQLLLPIHPPLKKNINLLEKKGKLIEAVSYESRPQKSSVANDMQNEIAFCNILQFF